MPVATTAGKLKGNKHPGMIIFTHKPCEVLEQFCELLLLLFDAIKPLLGLLVDVSPWAPTCAGQTAVQQHFCLWTLLLEGADFTVQPIDAFVRCGIFFDGDADYFTSFCIVAMLSKFGII